MTNEKLRGLFRLSCFSIILAGLLSAKQAAAANVAEHTKAYRAGEEHTANYLGVTVTTRAVPIKPGNLSIQNFEIEGSYQEPFQEKAKHQEFIPKRIIPAHFCDKPKIRPSEVYKTLPNSRGIRFVVEIIPTCVRQGQFLLPNVELRFSCTDADRELQWFDSVNRATGVRRVLRGAKTAYDIVGIVKFGVDVAKLVGGRLSIQGFIVRVVLDFAEDAVVDAAYRAADRAVATP